MMLFWKSMGGLENEIDSGDKMITREVSGPANGKYL